MKKMRKIGSGFGFRRNLSASSEHTIVSDERSATQGQIMRRPQRAGSTLAPGQDPSSHSSHSPRVGVEESSSFIKGQDLVASLAHAQGPENLSAFSRSRASQSSFHSSRQFPAQPSRPPSGVNSLSGLRRAKTSATSISATSGQGDELTQAKSTSSALQAQF